MHAVRAIIADLRATVLRSPCSSSLTRGLWTEGRSIFVSFVRREMLAAPTSNGHRSCADDNSIGNDGIDKWMQHRAGTGTNRCSWNGIRDGGGEVVRDWGKQSCIAKTCQHPVALEYRLFPQTCNRAFPPPRGSSGRCVALLAAPCCAVEEALLPSARGPGRNRCYMDAGVGHLRRYRRFGRQRRPDQATQDALVLHVHALGKKVNTHATDLQPYVKAILSKCDGPQRMPLDGTLNETVIDMMYSQKQYATPTMHVFYYELHIPGAGAALGRSGIYLDLHGR